MTEIDQQLRVIIATLRKSRIRATYRDQLIATSIEQLERVREQMEGRLIQIDSCLDPRPTTRIKFEEMIHNIPGMKHQGASRQQALLDAKQIDSRPECRGISHWMIIAGVPDLNRRKGSTLSLLYVWDEAGFVFSFDLKDHDPGYYEEPHWSQLLASASSLDERDMRHFRSHLVGEIDMYQIGHHTACLVMRHHVPEANRMIRGLSEHYYQVNPSNQPCTRDDNDFLRAYRVHLQQSYAQFHAKLVQLERDRDLNA